MIEPKVSIVFTKEKSAKKDQKEFENRVHPHSSRSVASSESFFLLGFSAATEVYPPGCCKASKPNCNYSSHLASGTLILTISVVSSLFKTALSIEVYRGVALAEKSQTSFLTIVFQEGNNQLVLTNYHQLPTIQLQNPHSHHKAFWCLCIWTLSVAAQTPKNSRSHVSQQYQYLSDMIHCFQKCIYRLPECFSFCLYPFLWLWSPI